MDASSSPASMERSLVCRRRRRLAGLHVTRAAVDVVQVVDAVEVTVKVEVISVKVTVVIKRPSTGSWFNLIPFQ